MKTELLINVGMISVLAFIVIVFGVLVVFQPLWNAENIKANLNKMLLSQTGSNDTDYNVSEVNYGYTAKLQNGTILYVNEKGCGGCGEGYYLDTEQYFSGCGCPSINLFWIIGIAVVLGILLFIIINLSGEKADVNEYEI